MVANKSRNVLQRDDLLNLIVGGDPAAGISGMADYFALGTPEGLISQLIDASTGAADQSDLSQAAADAIGSDPVTPIIKRLVLDTVKGAHLTRDLVDELKQLLSPDALPPLAETSNDLNRTLLVFGGQAIADLYGTVPINDFLGLNSQSIINDGEPTKQTPGLSAYIVKPAGISPGTKNTSALSLFMNSIPTVEFNRAVPFLELTMQVGRPALTNDGRLNSPSQLKFILGGANVAEGTADFSVATGAEATIDDGTVLRNDEGGQTAVAGMELFLSPQTMAPTGPAGTGFAELNAPSLRPTDVLNPFAPLISIDNVSINIAASTGFMSFKTATLEMTLHDASRLAEIADFVKPDLFSKTEFLMEYGWHHPDGMEFDVNPFGALLNAMRTREKYGIVNSSFRFGDNNEVQISLQLAMKGANEYRTVQIGSDENVQNALRDIAELQERIAEIRNAVNTSTLGGKRGGRSVFGEQILEAAQTTLGNPTISPKQRKKLRSIVGRLEGLGAGGNDKAQELADVLKELYIESPEHEKSAVDRLQSSVSSVIKEKFRALDGLSPTELADGAGVGETDEGELFGGDIAIDPFIDLNRITLEDLKAPGKTSKFVSFGKVFMTFVAHPIAATGRFDEVQVLFYPMNNGAGAARNRSVASLLIEREQLRREFETFVLDRRASNITVGEFQNFLNQTFVDNPANPSYGMATRYRQKKDSDGVVRWVPNHKGIRGKDKDDQWATELEQKLLDMGVSNGVFRPPHVDLHIESVPARVPRGAEGETREFKDEKTILRIHVFDKAATAYETQGELIRAMADDQLSTVGFVEPNSADDEGRQLESSKRIVEAADKLGLLERIPDDESSGGDAKGPTAKHFRIVGGPRELKRFVMSTAPYIIRGSQNTAVESLGLASIQDPALATVNMLRADRQGAATPEGSGKGGIPLKTIPARLDVTTMGCPLLSFMQTFFVDAQTGTDLDNLYSITQLSHTIDATTFKSSFEMVPVNAYGKYESTLHKTEQALGELEEYVRNASGG